MTPENIQEMYSAIKADPDGDGELISRHRYVPEPPPDPSQVAPRPSSRVAGGEEVRSQPCPYPGKRQELDLPAPPWW